MIRIPQVIELTFLLAISLALATNMYAKSCKNARCIEIIIDCKGIGTTQLRKNKIIFEKKKN